MCINLHIFELLSMLGGISATEVTKNLGGTNFHISSVDGNSYQITLLTNQLWDLILLKLTELVYFDRKSRDFDWERCNEWDIGLSIQTIAECLGVSTTTDSLVHLYDRIVDVVTVLQKIRIRVNHNTIDGYLGLAGERNCSIRHGYPVKSNAFFLFTINPTLIEYVKRQNPGLYHFNHDWLHLREPSKNTYAAAKRLGRLYSQNTYHRKSIPKVTLSIGVLRECLPCLNNKREKENRKSLDNAIKSIPGITYNYFRGNKELTFAELNELRLREGNYDKIEVAVKFASHPSAGNEHLIKNKIRDMNNDALYLGLPVCLLGEEDETSESETVSEEKSENQFEKFDDLLNPTKLSPTPGQITASEELNDYHSE